MARTSNHDLIYSNVSGNFKSAGIEKMLRDHDAIFNLLTDYVDTLTFAKLLDTPNSYAGLAGHVVVINETEDGLGAVGADYQQPAITNPSDATENLTATAAILDVLRAYGLIAA